MSNQSKVLFSPFIIIAVNVIIAITAGSIIGKWAFVPIILFEWLLFVYFIKKYGKSDSIKRWIQPTSRKWFWKVAAVFTGFITLPLFLLHYELLSPFHIWLPWILLALINPFLEEFYWRGLLMDYTKHWEVWVSVSFNAIIFAANHAVFGINSEINSGIETLIATFVMGLVWGIVYQKLEVYDGQSPGIS
jgi:membrane protease YdiL (CAAX protease family)